jgi:hypothetical protein
MNYFSAKRFLMTTAIVASTANVGLGMLKLAADQGLTDMQTLLRRMPNYWLEAKKD